MVFLKNTADHKALIDKLELLDETVYKVAELIAGTFTSGGKLIICGNGGSAADAQHMAAELSGRFLKDRKALDAVALNCNTSAITAIAMIILLVMFSQGRSKRMVRKAMYFLQYQQAETV